MRILARTLFLILIMTVFISALTFIGTEVVAAGEISVDYSEVNKVAGIGLRYLNVAGAIIAVVILAVYGIKWFFAGVQEKATLKANAWMYIVGALLVFTGPKLFEMFATVLAQIYKSPVG